MTLAESALWVAAVAVVCAWPPAAIVALPLAAHRLAGLLGSSRIGASATVAAAVYGPAAPGFLSDCDHCRGVWLWIWPVLPGGAIETLARVATGLPRWSDPVEFALAAIATLALLTIANLVAARGRATMMGVVTVLTALSALASWGAYSAVRS